MTVRRWVVLVVGLLVVGLVVPFVLATTGGRHGPNSVQGKPVQLRPAVGQTVIRSVGKPGLLHP